MNLCSRLNLCEHGGSKLSPARQIPYSALSKTTDAPSSVSRLLSNLRSFFDEVHSYDAKLFWSIGSISVGFSSDSGTADECFTA